MGDAEPESPGDAMNFLHGVLPIGWEAEPVDYNKIRE
jgi:hypothetical protein